MKIRGSKICYRCGKKKTVENTNFYFRRTNESLVKQWQAYCKTCQDRHYYSVYLTPHHIFWNRMELFGKDLIQDIEAVHFILDLQELKHG